jgi:hypothetical protein
MSDDDYEIQLQTIHMLGLFREGTDCLERGVDPEPPMEAVSNILHSMTDEEKGITIIDLLTLFCELESRVLHERAGRLMGRG